MSEHLLSPDLVLLLMTAALNVGLAIWVLRIARGAPALRALAFYLAMVAGTGVVSFVIRAYAAAPGAAMAAVAQVAWLEFSYAGPMLAGSVWLLLRYPRARPTPGPPWLVPGLILSGGALCSALLVLWPELGGTWASPTGLAADRVVTFGPLSLLLFLAVASSGLLAWVFARAHRRETDPSTRRSLFIVAFGFMVYPISRGVLGQVRALGFAVAGWEPAWIDTSTTSNGWALIALEGVVMGAGLGLALVAGWHLATSPDHRRGAAHWGVVTAIFGAAVLGVLRAYEARFDSALYAISAAALPLIVTYGMVRHRVFGLDGRVRWTVKQSTVAAAFIAVFFVVSELAAEIFSGTMGSVLGIVAAGALVFALAPLQRLAQRVSLAAVPDDQGPMAQGERSGVYLDLARHAWSDGALSPDEHDLLMAARQRLGIPADTAERLDRKARDEARGGPG